MNIYDDARSVGVRSMEHSVRHLVTLTSIHDSRKGRKNGKIQKFLRAKDPQPDTGCGSDDDRFYISGTGGGDGRDRAGDRYR